MATEQSNFDPVSAGESGIETIIISFLLREILPFAIHTISAILSGMIVAVVLYYFNKWLKKRDNS